MPNLPRCYVCGAVMHPKLIRTKREKFGTTHTQATQGKPPQFRKFFNFKYIKCYSCPADPSHHTIIRGI